MTTANKTATTTNASWTNRLCGGLVALTLVGAMALLPGCGSGPCDGEEIRVTWQLQANGQVVQCAPGDGVELRIDGEATPLQFPCADGSGVSSLLNPHTSHVVSVSLIDVNNQVISHTAPMTLSPLGCGALIDAPLVVFPVDAVTPVCGPGKIQASWFLSSNNQTVECAAGDSVDMRVDTDAMTVTFPCSDHSGLSPAITGGASHDVSFTLFDAGNNVLSQTSSMSIFVPCDTTKAAPQVEFSLTP